MTGKPWRRGLRLSVRAMMLIVLVFAVLLGRQVNRARRQRAAVDAVRKYGGEVHYDYEYVDGKPASGRESWGPVWLKGRIGDEFFQKVVFVSFIDNPSLISDERLAPVADMKDLKYLQLSSSRVTEKGLAHLKGLTNLEDLDLDGCKVGDEGLSNLAEMKNLRRLFLNGTDITDAGLARLRGLSKLTVLKFSGTRVTDAGVQDLKKSIPSLSIIWDAPSFVSPPDPIRLPPSTPDTYLPPPPPTDCSLNS